MLDSIFARWKFLALSLAGLVSVPTIYYGSKAMSGPMVSLRRIHAAYVSHDLILLEQYCDIDRIIDSALKRSTTLVDEDGMAYNTLMALGSFLAPSLTTQLRDAAADSVKESIRRVVAKQPMLGGNYEAMRVDLDSMAGALSLFNVKFVRELEDIASIGVMVPFTAIGARLVELKFEKKESYWKLVDIINSNELVLAYQEIEKKRQAEKARIAKEKRAEEQKRRREIRAKLAKVNEAIDNENKATEEILSKSFGMMRALKEGSNEMKITLKNKSDEAAAVVKATLFCHQFGYVAAEEPLVFSNVGSNEETSVEVKFDSTYSCDEVTYALKQVRLASGKVLAIRDRKKQL